MKEFHFDVLCFEGDEEDPAYIVVIQFLDDGTGTGIISGSEEIYIIFRQADIVALIDEHKESLCQECLEELEGGVETLEEADHVANVPCTHLSGPPARAMASTIALAMTAVESEDDTGNEGEEDEAAAPGGKKPHELN